MHDEEITALSKNIRASERMCTAQQIANHVQEDIERLLSMASAARSDYLHGRIEALNLTKNWIVETFGVR